MHGSDVGVQVQYTGYTLSFRAGFNSSYLCVDKAGSQLTGRIPCYLLFVYIYRRASSVTHQMAAMRKGKAATHSTISFIVGKSHLEGAADGCGITIISFTRFPIPLFNLSSSLKALNYTFNFVM